MTFLFLSLSIVIAIIVIAVSAKHIKAGMEARSDIKDVKETSLSSTDEDTLKKLKEKNLSPEDLKKIYEDLQKK
jgi:Flp pilus assembly protein TadB